MASPPQEPTPRASRGLRAHPFRAAGLALVVLLVGLRIAAPFAIERLIEREATPLLDRAVEVGNVNLSLARGRVELDRVYVGPPLGGTLPTHALAEGDVRFGARRVAVDLDLLDLLSGDVHVTELLVDTPRVLRVRDAAGRLPPLLALTSAVEDAGKDDTEPDAGGEVPPVSLSRLRVLRANFVYFDMAKPDRQPLEIGIGEFALNGLSLVDGEVLVRSASIHEPSLRVINDFELAALQADAIEAEVETQVVVPEAAAEPPPRVRIGEVSLSDAHLSVLGAETEVDGALTLRATDVSFGPGERFPLEIALAIDSGGIELKGQAGVSPPGFEGALTWHGLPLAELAHAAGPLFPGSLSSGTTSGELDLALDLDTRIRVSGRAVVADLALADEGGNEVGWQELDVVLEALELDPKGDAAPTLALSSLTLRKPALRFARAAPVATEAPAPAEPEAAGPTPQVRIDALEVSDGKLIFEDGSVRPAYRNEVRTLNMRGKRLRWPERSAEDLHVDIRSAGDESFSLDGSLGGQESGVDIALTGLVLSALTPYVAGAAGYEVNRGEADLDARIRQRGERMDVDSTLVLRRLAVTSVHPETFEKQFGMPLDLALALLRDPKGEIHMPIGFELVGEESRVDTGAIVLGALRQALVGALTSPLKGIGLLLPDSDEESGELGIAPVAFAPGSTQLPPGAEIEPLAALLDARPGLALRLRGSVGDQDAPGIAERVLIALVLADADLPPVDAGFLQRRRIRSALAERGRGETGELEPEDAAALSKWLDAVDVSASDREAFAQERAETLRAALLELPPVTEERVAIAAPLAGEPAVVVELGSVQP